MFRWGWGQGSWGRRRTTSCSQRTELKLDGFNPPELLWEALELAGRQWQIKRFKLDMVIGFFVLIKRKCEKERNPCLGFLICNPVRFTREGF